MFAYMSAVVINARRGCWLSESCVVPKESARNQTQLLYKSCMCS